DFFCFLSGCPSDKTRPRFPFPADRLPAPDSRIDTAPRSSPFLSWLSAPGGSPGGSASARRTASGNRYISEVPPSLLPPVFLPASTREEPLPDAVPLFWP